MKEAIKDILDWGEKYGNDACLNRLLSIMGQQLTEQELISLAAELWEWEH